MMTVKTLRPRFGNYCGVEIFVPIGMQGVLTHAERSTWSRAFVAHVTWDKGFKLGDHGYAIQSIEDRVTDPGEIEFVPRATAPQGKETQQPCPELREAAEQVTRSFRDLGYADKTQEQYRALSWAVYKLETVLIDVRRAAGLPPY